MPKRIPTAHHRRQRERLLDAARDLMAAAPHESVTLAQVARAAGMTAPAIYAYFPSREDLFVEVVDRAIDAVVDDVVSNDDPDAPAAARLRTRFARWSRHEGAPSAALACVHRAFLDPSPHPAVRAALQRGTEATTAWFRAVIATGIERGEVRPDVDPSVVAEVVNAAFAGIELGSHHGLFVASAPVLLEATLDVVLARLAPEPSAPVRRRRARRAAGRA